jgi:putative colanic acid biosynthesis acetyltransferase WcaF
MQLWEICWSLFCAWTPKKLIGWRLAWLRLFGAHLEGRPFVHQRARIQRPWNLTMYDGAALGDRANAYTQGEVVIGPRATIAQEAYLCSGSHDFDDPVLPLITAPVVVEADAFVGARAFIMPGVTVGEGAIVGAAAVITRDVPAWTVWVGNPARFLRNREPFTSASGRPDERAL